MSTPLPSGARSEQRTGLRRRLSRLLASQAEVDAQHEQAQSARLGGTRVADLRLRERATICGTLRSVTLRPRAGVPALVAELFDGTGTVSVVWVGRRRIAGIEPGRRLKIQGLVTEADGTLVVYNPRYELIPASSV